MESRETTSPSSSCESLREFGRIVIHRKALTPASFPRVDVLQERILRFQILYFVGNAETALLARTKRRRFPSY